MGDRFRRWIAGVVTTVGEDNQDLRRKGTVEGIIQDDIQSLDHSTADPRTATTKVGRVVVDSIADAIVIGVQFSVEHCRLVVRGQSHQFGLRRLVPARPEMLRSLRPHRTNERSTVADRRVSNREEIDWRRREMSSIPNDPEPNRCLDQSASKSPDERARIDVFPRSSRPTD